MSFVTTLAGISLGGGEIDVYVLIPLFDELDVIDAVLFKVDGGRRLPYEFVVYENICSVGHGSHRDVFGKGARGKGDCKNRG